MGSGASKKVPAEPTGNQPTPRRAATTSNRRAEFQEVEVRAPSNGRPADMSSRNNESKHLVVSLYAMQVSSFDYCVSLMHFLKKDVSHTCVCQYHAHII